jgi:hypothetical protein
MAGKVTEFAKKRFEQGDKNVSQYLAQVNAQINQDLQSKSAGKNSNDAKNLVNSKQIVSKEKIFIFIQTNSSFYKKI